MALLNITESFGVACSWTHANVSSGPTVAYQRPALSTGPKRNAMPTINDRGFTGLLPLVQVNTEHPLTYRLLRSSASAPFTYLPRKTR